MLSNKASNSLDKEFFSYITDRDRFRVRIKTRPSARPTFSIQLECNFGDDDEDWQVVIRADDWHDRPHLDILSPDGSQQKKWQYDYGDNKINMKECFKELKTIWEAQRERYENELNRFRTQ